MYQPPHFIETDRETLLGLIRARPLGLLISATENGPVADPIPFLLDTDIGEQGRLRAHVARANPQWKLIASQPEVPVLVVFQGSDAYVTPSWYETKRETGKVVPTWNYAIVQVRGAARIMDDREWLARQIRDLTASREMQFAEPWAVDDAPPPFVDAQIKGIVGIEIDILSIDGKWKVSQNRPEADRRGVAAGLDEQPDAAAMAGLVRKYGKLDG
ncbi:MAG: FMN-binding negative transcriptional regulator [Rhizobiaceae bacterium]|nr:FMN-binding negative transcriptional regulator [Rhizobiaceae bacterium]